MPKVVITLPAYRAEATLGKTIADIPPGIADELILVDDASPDNTAQLAREMGITVYVHPENRGYGGNQKTCYAEALRDGADVVVMLHPDYQYDPKAVPLLIAPILSGDADMTFGSRFAGMSDPREGGMPLYRYYGNRITTTLENLMLGTRFTEMHSGMRAYTRRCLLSMPFLSYSDDFWFDSQFMVDAVTGGQRVVEVPIPTRYTKESSSIAIGRSLRYIGHSIAYAAMRSAERGRRGKRGPVAGKGASAPPGTGEVVEHKCSLCAGTRHARVGGPVVRCARCRLGVSLEPSPFEPSGVAAGALTATLDGYHVRGRRLASLFDRTVVRAAAGWDAGAVDLDGLDALAPGGVDAIALAGVLDRIDDPLGVLRRARAALDGEGVLGVTLDLSEPGDPAGRRTFFSPRTTAQALRVTGFRLVGWSTGGAAAIAIAIARPDV